MQRLKRSSLFWTLLLVTVMLPVGLRATKLLYSARITDAAGSGKGSAVLMMRGGPVEYMSRTFALPGMAVNEVWLAPSDGSWRIPLCTNGGPTVDDCTYAADGNLDIDGAVTPSMLMAAGVTGAQFNSALTAGTLAIVLSDGSSDLGWGYFVRIL